MKNYIIFYTAIILFVIAGVKGTSYVIQKENEEKLAKINFHQNVTDLLAHGGEVSREETTNKQIILYLGFTGEDRTQADFLRLNELNEKYKDQAALYLFLRAGKEYMESYFKKLEVEPSFKTIYKPAQLYNYIEGLTHYFYTGEELNEIKVRTPYVVVVSKTGKIKLFKIGYGKDLPLQVEAALKE